jgi:hypothetical protein
MALLDDMGQVLNLAGQERVDDRQKENHRGHHIKWLGLNSRREDIGQTCPLDYRIGIKRERKKGR